jgi:hypothetical protein
MNKKLGLTAFVVGLSVVVWVGSGYIGSNPLAFLMTGLIGAFYLMGALELRRFHQATAALGRALAATADTSATPANLADWLHQLPGPLQTPVRLRVEGERVGLPGPAMTPYLVGLLVLLGMLGTFLGMVVTLKGAVMALESTTDLATIRAALAAPVKGLGLAFGTSVAGVAASAMLGLLSALCRRERQQAAQALDSRAATVLRPFSRAHQREQTLLALQSQAALLPDVADRLQAMMAQLERQGQALNDRLLAGQEGFHRDAKAAYSGLAASVGQSLQASLTESARVAGATIQPVVQATMAGIAHETTQLHQAMARTVGQQLDGLSARLGSQLDAAASGWASGLARHERSSDALSQGLREALAGFNTGFEQRSAALLDSVAQRHSALQGELTATVSGLVRETGVLHSALADSSQVQLAAISAQFSGTTMAVSQAWEGALARQQQRSDQQSADLQHAVAALVHSFEQGSAALLVTVDQAHAGWQAEQVAQDQQRLAAWTASLAAMAATLQQDWQQAGVDARDQQAQLCKTLEQTAAVIQRQAEGQARATIAEMAALMQAAAQAPRAAAEVMAQLRQQLSDSLVRDNGVLEERSRILATLNALLGSVSHAATEQRGAIDALVASSAAMLQQVGSQFSDRIEAESSRMSEVAAQITGSAVEVASLGEAFGLAVQLFSASSDTLVAGLQRIEAALGKSTTRSDEQLAYYVTQAREVIDLSLLSQKQIVEDLQRLASRPALRAGEVA